MSQIPSKAMLNRTQEYTASTMSGYPPLLLALLAIPAGVLSMSRFDAIGGWAIAGMVLAIVVLVFLVAGFYLIAPNHAYAIQLFGTYKGTDRTTGLRWVLPWLMRKKISVRVHNITSDRLKVNDLRGNPVEIAANVVWRVTDSAQALFDVDDYKQFIHIQIESAVRAICSKYPYDDIEHKEVTLRGDADVISEELRIELQERVDQAGITIDECRLTHLAYAQEIAQAMLRRQQADAIIAARARIVAGAVGMVEMALAELSSKDIVNLDDERKAAMVSNLMVVLCSERDTQPVVNTGTLYQ